MSVTTGEELGKSAVFVNLAMTLSPLVVEPVRQCLTIKTFERGLFGGLLWTGKQVIDQFPMAQGDGAPGETTAHPADSNDEQSTERRMIHQCPELAAGMLPTVFGEQKFSAYVYREGEDRRSPIERRPTIWHKSVTDATYFEHANA